MTLIVLSLSKFGGYFGILRTLRPAFLLFVFCVGYAFLHKKKLMPTNLAHSWTVGLICALGFTVVGSAIFGLSLGHSATFFLNDFSKTLAITFLMILTIRDIADVRRLCWAVALGAIVLAYLSIFVVGISKVTGGVTYDANDIGVFMVMGLPLVLMLFQSATGRLERVVAVAGIVLLAVTIVKTQSRGAFIGAIVVALALLFVPGGVSVGKRIVFVAAASISMAVAAPAGYWTSMQTIVQDPKSDYNWDSVNGRRNLARRGIGYMMEYPVFGVGVDNFRVAEGTISEKALNLAPGHGIRWASPHNSFVQAGAEAGIVGLVLWVALVIVNIVTPRRLRRRMPKSWRTGTPEQRFFAGATLYLPVAQIGFAVTAFFVSFAWMEPLYFFSALVAGLSLIAEREMRPPQTSIRQSGFRSLRSRVFAGVASFPLSPTGTRS